jgi:hypothetical protein
MKEYPYKQMPAIDNIEVEHGETIQLPDGNVYQVNGKSHKRGGENVYAPDGSRVYSQHLKLPPKVSKELGGPERKVSPAELSKKYPTQNYRTMLEQAKNDPIKQKTAALMHSKHLAMQEAIFNAQESMKVEKKINKKSFRYGGLKKYQGGDQVPGGLTWYGNPNPTLGQPTGAIIGSDLGNADFLSRATSPGWTEPIMEHGINVGTRRYQNLSYQNQPDPYFTEVYGKNRTGYLKGQPGGQELGAWQQRITNVENFAPTPSSVPTYNLNSAGQLVQSGTRQVSSTVGTDLMRGQAQYERSVNERNPDQYLRHTVTLADGKTIPISEWDGASPLSNLNVVNQRTGQPTFQDFREGNAGDPTSNQAFIPLQVSDVRGLQRLDMRGGIPGTDFKKLPLPTRTEPPAPTPQPRVRREVERTLMDPEQYYNAVMGGMDLFNLASLRRENPYYALGPSNVSTTRFDPINTLQNERAFNLAKNSLENSNLPESVKQSQLAQLQSSMMEGVNQVDLTNYQGSLANQNANIQRVDAAREFNTQNRNQANMNYLEQLGRSRNMMELQRQEFLDRMTDRWRTRMQNRQRIDLINKMVPNYEFNTRTGLNYKPGSTPMDTTMLDAYLEAAKTLLPPTTTTS